MVYKLTANLLFPVELKRMKLGQWDCQHPHIFDDRNCSYEVISTVST